MAHLHLDCLSRDCWWRRSTTH